MIDYRANQFFLNDTRIAWVEEIKSRMSLKQKVGQLFLSLGIEAYPTIDLIGEL